MKSLLCLAVAIACLTLSEGGLGIFKSKPAIQHAFQNLKEFLSSFSERYGDDVQLQSAHRQRRQSDRCFRDYQETLSDQFIMCNQMLEYIQEASVLTLQNATAFCRNHCPSYMIRFAQKVAVDCDLPDPLDPVELEFVNQTCAQGPNNVSCLIIWNNTEAALGSNTSSAAVTYQKCIEENQRNSKICNTDCKPAEQWIKDNLGCCYKALVDYYSNEGVTEGFLTDDNWDICNIKEPQTCSYSRPQFPTRPPPRTRGPPLTRPPFTRSPPKDE